MGSTSQTEAKDAVQEVQRIDPKSVVRTSQLGPFALDEAEEPVERLVRLFMQIPVEHISELPDQQANQLRDQANAVLSLVQKLGEFDPTVDDNPKAKQQSLIANLVSSYPSTFTSLWHHIGYLSSRERDFAAMEVEARAMIDKVKADTDELREAMDQQKEDAEKVLEDIKQVAAETGVSQQAIHFSTESANQSELAEKWEGRTVKIFVALVVYGVVTIFLHKVPWIKPDDTYETVQLAVSKIVVFIALFYALTLSAKNYLAHKHSSAVNKHRQNALATYKAIADAAHDEAGRDIVLSHAADCIFSPQETGYLANRKSESGDSAPTLQVLPRVASGVES